MLQRKEGSLTKLEMTEGDYGTALPMVISGGVLDTDEKIKISIYDYKTHVIKVVKEYSNITNGTFDFSLTKEESALLPVGDYVYSVEWFQEDTFVGTLINAEDFTVKGKGIL
ncbi:MAG: hypothetical protein J6C46_08650 [Clostridia bacterium]|nr:hypothetical protein [Clostridia bacterium]